MQPSLGELAGRAYLVEDAHCRGELDKAYRLLAAICVVCGAPAVVAGAYAPEDQAAWNVPAGKIRVIPYMICGTLEQRGHTAEEVERVIDTLYAQGQP